MEDLKVKGYIISFVGLWGLGIGRNVEYLFFNYGFDFWYGVVFVNKEFCMESYKIIFDLLYIW